MIVSRTSTTGNQAKKTKNPNKEEESKIYEATKAHVQKAMGSISSRKIFSIDHKHKDKLYHAEVGKEEKKWEMKL